MIDKWSMKEIILWSTPLKNGGAHPLFYGGMRTHYFMGACALIFKRARRAPIILGGLDEHSFLRGHKHSLFKGKQAKSNCKVDMKEKVHEMLSWKNGCARTHYFGGTTSTDYFGRARRAPILKGREHSSFREHSIRELMNKHIWIWKESQKNKLMKYSLEKWGRAPIILWGHAHSLFYGGMRTHYFGGSTSTHF